VARRHRLRLVEDACEALGSSVAGRAGGSFGDLGAFAVYPNKQVTTGEGGMLVTDDDALADVLRSLRNQGRDADGTWLRHVRLGFNYRLDELSAALGVAQLRRRAEMAAGRAEVAASYAQRLGGLDWLRLPSVATGASVDWFVYVVRLAPGIDRDRLVGQLAAAGIPSRPYFSPIHLQPIYRTRFGFEPGAFPITERVAASTLALPFASTLADADVDRVCVALVAAVQAQGVA
jgi:dTDP-4-amino-4,6-dideoxygalactose transaminase